MRSRTLVNLVTVIIASAVLLLFAVTQLLASAVLDNNYPLYVELSAAGGLLTNKEVTYRGVSVGEIIDVTLCDDDTVSHGPDCASPDSVRVEMGIDNGIQIPEGVEIVVLRQSAVGEQALDIRPLVAIGPTTEFYEQDDVVLPGDVTLPTKPQELLELANEVFGPIDADNAATVVSELADAVEGRSEDLQRIMVDSAVLSESVGDNGADYDRFFAASRIVNASLAENRQILAALITDLADGAELIGELRGQVDGLLDTAPPVLAATTSLLERGDANLSCVVRDLANLNEFVNQPEVLGDLEETIRVNDFFFDAFRIIGPDSALGNPWLRVQFLLEPEPTPLLYTPPRPIPPTLPGGACESVFGPGAGSAVQPNHQLAAPEGQVIRPDNDRQAGTVLTSARVTTDLSVAGTDPVAVDPFAVAADTGGAASSPVVALVVAAGVLLFIGVGRALRQRSVGGVAVAAQRIGHKVVRRPKGRRP